MSVSKAEFERLQASLRDGRLQEAGALANQLLQQYRDPFSDSLVRGLMSQAEGKDAQAYTFFSQAAVIVPEDGRSYLGIAQSLFLLRHYQKAIAASEQALRLDPANADAGLVLADSLAALGEWGPAIEQYQRVLAMGAASTFVHLGLGLALQCVGRLADARDQFSHVVRMAPDRAAGYCLLANTLMASGQCQEAIGLYRQALPLATSQAAVIHANMAGAFLAMRDFSGAEAASRRALALSPGLPEAHGKLAEALRGQRRYGEAAPHYQKHGMPESSAKALECLYLMGALEAFEIAQKELSEVQPDNIRLAAISALAAAQHGKKYASRFCAAPLSYIAISNLASRLEPFEAFTADILRETGGLDAVWEPPAKTTKGGFQTEGNIFDLGTPMLARLQKIIRESIETYFEARAGVTDRYVAQRPRMFTLAGWVVRLRQAGRQDPHIHPDGWLSGVLYLRLPPRASADEGAIAFTPGGYLYQTGSSDKPDFLHRPRAGDLVLFPSSLFHYTVPFSADAERISLAFDLLPPKA
jgi:tetratricopeptide (TPR) repeat protein